MYIARKSSASWPPAARRIISFPEGQDEGRRRVERVTGVNDKVARVLCRCESSS